MSDEKPIEGAHRDAMNKLAEVLQEMFDGYGFCLLVFPIGGSDGRMNYISNAERKDMLVSLKEFVARNEGRVPKEPETPQ